jgi:hypothetical protein
MIEEFSGSYYLGRLYVEPSTDGRARMARHQHRELHDHLYAASGADRFETPLVVKLDNAHFPVGAGNNVPADTLVVPDEVVGDHRRTPDHREVLIAKADRARQLLRFSGTHRPSDAT